MPKWERRVDAARRGALSLQPRIDELRCKLKHLEKAALKLWNLKYQAQLHLVEVKVIPLKRPYYYKPKHTFEYTYAHASEARKEQIIAQLSKEMPA